MRNEILQVSDDLKKNKPFGVGFGEKHFLINLKISVLRTVLFLFIYYYFFNKKPALGSLNFTRNY